LGKVSPWSPHFDPPLLPAALVAGKSPDIVEGSKLFNSKSCEECHKFQGNGGLRGPDLSNIANRYTRGEIVGHILNGGENMPAFGGILSSQELDQIVAFLESGKTVAFEEPR
jgi:ubiquinol-cytochrome c reductase cytochrome b subunit